MLIKSDNIKNTAEKHDHKSNLPVPYINPWFLLFENLSAIGSDLSLRFRELLRRNQSGQFYTPSFLNPFLSVLFWPSVLVTFLFLFSNLFINILPSTDLKETTGIDSTILSSSIVNNNNSTLTSNASTKSKNEEDSFNKSYEALELPNQIDSVAFSILNREELFSEFEIALLEGVTTSYFGNSVLIKLGSSWAKLDFSEHESFIQKLYDSFENFGYGKFLVFDENGFIVARQSRLGEGMIMYPQVFE